MQVLGKLPIWLLLSVSALGIITGDYFAKFWSINQRTIFVVLAICGYAVSSFFYIPTLLKQGLVITSLIWSLLAIIGFMFVGLYLFHETLTPMQWVGVGVGIISLIILSVAH